MVNLNFRQYCGCGNTTIYKNSSDDSNCPTKCSGNNQDACGGKPYYGVYLIDS